MPEENLTPSKSIMVINVFLTYCISYRHTVLIIIDFYLLFMKIIFLFCYKIKENENKKVKKL